MNEIKILIADDHSLVRAGIKALLENISDVKVICEASDGREALEMIGKFNPDIVIADIAMPELNGLELAQYVARDFPETEVIILSMYSSDEYVIQALQNGASAYLIKDSAVNELEIAIRAVIKGEKYLSPVISKQVISTLLEKESPGKKEKLDLLQKNDRLTPRQREILQLIAEGNSTKEIAYKLNLSIKTAETHRKQIMDRLEIHDIPGLVKYAIKKGIIPND